MYTIITVLMLWTPVASTPSEIVYDWRPLATFTSFGNLKSDIVCEQAAKELQLTKYKCVGTQVKK
jgi:hypothetical protein